MAYGVRYYPAWDWVIAASTYEDELLSGIPVLESIQDKALRVIIGLGLAAVIIAIVCFGRVGRNLSHQLGSLVATAQCMASGDMDRAAAIMKKENS